ncbi:hypothetical protein GPECTOR_38g302 [Gonium pectorale]|uniref:Uncharacterized protein n=1 Tax=Gonium pectorale TaxID=33097 RepID=A0A150GBZ0_GONPE|nr:hypothetical protein GPECTOR_38g302 [Gonium pectorale]|eukprot:KXZ47065.1 hypothetical protein GPECTOR_38g302 [Gonium pectorale]
MSRPKEPPPQAAPYGELLYSARRIGYDLWRRAQDPAAAAGLGAWQATWIQVLLRLRTQLRRRLHTRSTVSKYGTGVCLRSQPIANYAQLQAAVDLLLLLVTELPNAAGPRPRVAPEALDAVEHLLCESPFVDFKGSDPQARAILLDGALQLARLATARARADAAWRVVQDVALERLVSWLELQSGTVRELRAPGLALGLGLGGAADSATPLVRLVGPALARRLLVQDLVAALLEPGLAAEPLNGPCRAEALALLHATLLSLMPASRPASAGGGGDNGNGHGGGQGGDVHMGGFHGTEEAAAAQTAAALSEACELVHQSGLRIAAEHALRLELRQPDSLLAQSPAAEPSATSCRDTAVALLGSVYAVLYGRGVLHGWVAVESAACQVVLEGTPAFHQPHAFRKAWEAPGDRRSRRLVVHLLAHVVRGLGQLGRMGPGCRQQPLLSAALRCDPPGPRAPSPAQLGLLGLWLRAALDCGDRTALAALTAELLRHSVEARALFGCEGADAAAAVQGCDSFGSTAYEALATQAAVALADDADGTFRAQMAAALTSGMVRQRRFADVRGVIVGLDASFRALWEDLPPLPADVAAAAAAAEGATSPAPSLPTGSSVSMSGAQLPDDVLLAHRAMAAVALAALEPCADGLLARHAAVVGASAGVGSGGAGYPGRAAAQPAASWAEQQEAVRLLEEVARAVVVDAAALVRWEGALQGGPAETTQAASGWNHRLVWHSAAGLLPHLVAAMARSADARADAAADAAQAGSCSVIRRCMALLCLFIAELPQPGEVYAAANEQLRALALSSVTDHLWAAPQANVVGAVGAGNTGAQLQPVAPQQVAPQPGPSPGPLPGLQALDTAAADNLSRLLHRCIAGPLREYVTCGIQARVPTTAPPRRAADALTWIRELVARCAAGPRPLLERLLPPLLRVIVQGLADIRERLLSHQLLKCDVERPDAGAAADGTRAGDASQPAPVPSWQFAPSLGLFGELLRTAATVLRVAAGAGLLAGQEEANATPWGTVRIEASPLLRMEPAPLAQLRAACGFSVALLTRTCLECFALPFESDVQSLLLQAHPPPEAERVLAVSRRLQSSFGNMPVLLEAEKPVELHKVFGQETKKVLIAAAPENGADAKLKLSETAIDCAAELARDCGSGGEAARK